MALSITVMAPICSVWWCEVLRDHKISSWEIDLFSSQHTSGLQPFPSLHHESLVKSPVCMCVCGGGRYCLNNLVVGENLYAFQEGDNLRWPLWVTPFWGQGRLQVSMAWGSEATFIHGLGNHYFMRIILRGNDICFNGGILFSYRDNHASNAGV